ncbi:glycosyl transferase [Waterburya agarophytonicola K14]|uniref:Glycosyl transferase n=1 Tax=Waterburya agarophytonicola KI4 TaxID=2874699 RepID=A0A964BWH2_9CYAN|nr:glycosyl transferase [Waterburya agarophytonicola]MCC0179041.1 glycosyl transferase [Waterburya agarophytonicola KI4]
MSQPAIYIAVTSHGFGHAVRAATVAEKLRQLCPDLTLIFVTVAPQWLLKSYVKKDFIYRQRIFDVGVIQSDSLTMDKAATLSKMQHIIAESDNIIAEEAQFIRDNNVQLILGDIPALAAPIARAAGIPCWMMSNFGWDFIYRQWGEDFAEVVSWIENYYGQSDRLFRLPLSEPMGAFPNITNVGLTGCKPCHEQLKARFDLTAPQEKTILLTFGGLGLQETPYHNLEYFPDWQFITFDRNAPDLPNLVKVQDNSLRPLDFMPICDRVFSKPGYSTFSEAIYCDLPIVTLTRQGFAEAEVLLNGIQDYSRHQIVSTEEFFTGNWDFLRQALTPPRQADKLAKDGVNTIAQEISNLFEVS